MFSMRLCGRRCFLRVIQQKFSHLSALGDADVVYTRWRAGPARGARIDSRTGTGGGEHVLRIHVDESRGSRKYTRRYR